MIKRTAPIWKPMLAKAVKSRPQLDRAVKVITDMRRKFKTRTKTRTTTPGTEMEYTRTPSEGNSISYFTRKALRAKGLKKRVMRTMPIQLRKTEIVANLQWVYGRQGVLTIINNTNAELASIAGSIPGNTLTTQLMLQSTKMHYMLSSGSKAGIKLRIYEGCYKKDIPTVYTPSTLWQDGIINTGSTESINSIDSKPFSSVGFLKQCHISKVTNIFLPQGRTHEHYVDYRYNKMYNREESNLSGNAYLKGWTRFTMFVAYGEPVADTDSDITTAGGRIIMVGTKTQRFRFNNPTNYSANYTQTIPTTNVTQERLFDEGSGEIELNAVL